MTTPLIKGLDTFIAELDLERIGESLPSESGTSTVNLTELVGVYGNEARATLTMIEPYLDANQRILEVGAGLCLLSLFLRSQGYDIIALEPAQGGFDHFDALKNSILALHEGLHLSVLEKTAQDLDPIENGCFDLIFSNNVLEHIPDLKGAVSALAHVLEPGGQMIHTCPNYTVPYEPHFGLPVFKSWPRITKFFWPDKINSQLELWDSLNFVSYFQMRKIVARYQLEIKFSKHVMYDAFSRIGQDSEFAKRHSRSAAGRIYRVLVKLRLLNLIKLIPPALSTPMIFEISHEKNQ